MNQQEIIDKYFQEHRAKLIDIASFLDRVDRCAENEEDFRVHAMKKCIQELLVEQSNRAERILLLLSDKSRTPVDQASTKGASGAVPLN